jgi:hypothetical protein
MSLSLLPIQDAITTKLRELPQDVYENGVPDDAQLAYSTTGKLLPFIVASYAGYVPDVRNKGITGARYDLGKSYAVFMCVGPSERSARQVADLVLDKMTGFKATNAGELEPDSVGRPYMVNDSASKPAKYVSEVAFIFSVNTVVS